MRKFITTVAKTLVAVVALAAVTNCGVTPDETVTADTAVYNAPADTDADRNDEDEVDIIVTNCESWGMTYDAINNTCVDDETDTNVIAPPPEPERPTTSCADFGLIYDAENNTCVEPELPIAPAPLAE